MNSRRLNAPDVKPRDTCTTFAFLIPVALCTVDFGRSRALRTSDADRLAQPASVSAHAQAASPAVSAGANHALKAVTSVNPDAQPSRTKLARVSGVAHSWRKRRHA